jgi:hypothetical protein
MPCEEVLENLVYIHDEGQLRYRVEELLLNLTGYERLHNLGSKAVVYSQLEDGELFPEGTRYVRSEEDFKANFSQE